MSKTTNVCSVCKKDSNTLFKIQDGINACDSCYTRHKQKVNMTRMVTQKEVK